MPSDAAKKRAAKKKEARERKAVDVKRPATGASQSRNGDATSASVEASAASLTALTLASARTCTGVLTSHPMSRDVHISSFSLSYQGLELLTDTKLELNWGRRYGLVGLNGCGESRKSNVIVLFPSYTPNQRSVPSVVGSVVRCTTSNYKNNTFCLYLSLALNVVLSYVIDYYLFCKL